MMIVCADNEYVDSQQYSDELANHKGFFYLLVLENIVNSEKLERIYNICCMQDNLENLSVDISDIISMSSSNEVYAENDLVLGNFDKLESKLNSSLYFHISSVFYDVLNHL
jgi:hypothetical protein